jgi:hypothetical protein
MMNKPSKGGNMSVIMAQKQENVNYYDENMTPPFIESPLDSMKYENTGISLSEAIQNNGGKFFIFNADILKSER